jgi:hypothetical protein
MPPEVENVLKLLEIRNVPEFKSGTRTQVLLAGSMAQGCQMVCFQTMNPNLGKFWRAL